MIKYDKTILIAEDEEYIRQSLEEFVSVVFGYDVETAEDGKIALDMIKNNIGNYCIILTDLKMPNMDGLELIRQAKSISEDLIFIILTGYATKENAVTALKQGAYDFVHKPFNVDELTAVFKRAMEHWSLREENKNYQKNLERLVEERTVEIQSMNRDLKNLFQLGENVNRIKDFRERINVFREGIVERFNPETVVLMIYDTFSSSFVAPWVTTGDGFNVELPSGTELLKKKKRFFFDSDLKIDNPKLHLNKDDSEYYFARIEYEVFLGYLYLGFKEKRNLLKLQHRLNLYLSNLESLLYSYHLNLKHQREMEQMFLSGIKVIADTVEASSPFTRKHSDRVEKVAKFIAERLNFSYEKKYLISIACILHDIGKVGIDTSLVYKPGALAKDELLSMQRHPELGAKIVKNLYGFKIDHIIKYHHERWDGKGYPDGLKGDEIPIESRIIAIADAFDAMVSDRPYRKARPIPEVLRELRACSGTQFDPELIEVFLGILDEDLASFKLLIMVENDN